MPLDPDKLREVTEKAQTLLKRFDSFVERRAINDAADDDDEDEDEDIDIEHTEEIQLVEPARAAMRATPGSDLANPEFEEPWY
jgi:hypothetical protein